MPLPAKNPPKEPAAEDNPAPAAGWWSRPCGGRDVLAIALPLVVQTAFWSIMWFIDRMYLMWYSKESMAAALPAGMFFWTLICFPQGIAAFVNTFVAQYHGAGRPERIGLAVKQGIWFGWLTTPLFLLAIPLAPWLFSRAGATPAIIHQEVLYFQTLTLGAGALVLSAAMASFYTGRGLTRVVMLVDVAGSLVNIVLDYVLIFGEFGFPEMGIAGAGLATAIANWSIVLVYWLLMLRTADRHKYGLDLLRFDFGLFWRMVRFGVPAALPLLVEGGAFSLLIKHVSAIGENEAAATNLAFNVNSVAFVPLIGVSIGVSTLVGQKLGENRPDLACARHLDGPLAGPGLYGRLCAPVFGRAGSLPARARGQCQAGRIRPDPRADRHPVAVCRAVPASSTPCRSSSSAHSKGPATPGSSSATRSSSRRWPS